MDALSNGSSAMEVQQWNRNAPVTRCIDRSCTGMHMLKRHIEVHTGGRLIAVAVDT